MRSPIVEQRVIEWVLMTAALVLILLDQKLLGLAALAPAVALVGYRLLQSTDKNTSKPSPRLASSLSTQEMADSTPKFTPNEIFAAEETLRTTSQRLRVAIESARDGLLILDENGNLVECNPAAERLLGIERERFIGKQFVEMLGQMMEANELNGLGYSPGELSELARSLRIQQARITRRQFTSAIQTANGSQRLYIEEIGSPVYSATGKVIGRMLVLRDMSEHEMLNDFRDKVTHMAVHDLRGPLTAILNGIDLSLQTEAPLSEPERQRILRLCLDSGNSLMRQIESLLDIAQIESNSLPIKPEPQSVSELVDDSYQAIANTFTEMRTRLENNLPPDLPLILVDKEIMRRVFINLLDNALRFTTRGTSIRIDAELTPVDKSEVVISISDNGPGIPMDQRERIFETYRRINRNGAVGTITPVGRRGFGLGLTFCKLAIEAHGGKIWIEDGINGMTGARFVVRLPVSQ